MLGKVLLILAICGLLLLSGCCCCCPYTPPDGDDYYYDIMKSFGMDEDREEASQTNLNN